MHAGAVRTRQGRRLARLIVIGGAGAALWLAACVVVLANPATDAVAPTDATYFLSSPGGEAALTSGSTQNWPGIRVVSRPKGLGNLPRFQVCDAPGTVCLTPVPETTQGEAEAFAAEAERRGWTSVTVVTHTSHIARARLLLARCFPGTIRMVAIPTEHGAGAWLNAFVHETAGWAKAAVTPGCHDHLPFGD